MKKRFKKGDRLKLREVYKPYADYPMFKKNIDVEFLFHKKHDNVGCLVKIKGVPKSFSFYPYLYLAYSSFEKVKKGKSPNLKRGKTNKNKK